MRHPRMTLGMNLMDQNKVNKTFNGQQNAVCTFIQRYFPTVLKSDLRFSVSLDFSADKTELPRHQHQFLVDCEDFFQVQVNREWVDGWMDR